MAYVVERTDTTGCQTCVANAAPEASAGHELVRWLLGLVVGYALAAGRRPAATEAT